MKEETKSLLIYASAIPTLIIILVGVLTAYFLSDKSDRAELPCCNDDKITDSRTVTRIDKDLTLPYSHQFTKPLAYDSSVVITGVVPTGATRTTINMWEPDNIAFFLELRYGTDGQTRYVRNSFNFRWEKEEAGAPASNLIIAKGSEISIKIYIKRDAYMVYVNNIYMFDFKNRRADIRNISKLIISNEFILNKVQINYPTEDIVVF